MFVIDSLIGNTDRHNGNWGFLVDIKTNKIEFAPIYDCGSCLNPMIDDDEINKFIDEISCMSNERKEFYKKIINIRYKIIKEVYNKINNEKIDT